MRISDWSSDVCSSDLSPVHEGERLVDQALGAAALGGRFPFIAAADAHRRIDMAAGDLVGRDACSLAAENGIENVEKHVKAALLERRRREAGRQAHGRGARQTPDRKSTRLNSRH